MTQDEREFPATTPNPVGIEGIEFVEFATRRPQALGQVLETIGFRPIARHRSREVLLYRQGDMNIIVNAHPDDQPRTAGGTATRAAAPDPGGDTPTISAFALRVRDAGFAWRRVVECGAWEVPVRNEVMELHIPAIRCAGGSRIYFVDRWREFSIYDVDFVPIPTVDAHPPAIAGLHWFGIVQYVGPGRSDDWLAFYRSLFGFEPIPDEVRFGILHKGQILRSPCGTFYVQLVEADWDAAETDAGESLRRIGFGAPDVMAAVAALRALGIGFIDTDAVRPTPRGAVTQAQLGGVMFELVRDAAGAAAGDAT
ncbi:MAG: 4-hydroxyphenylpyruvate dioxygenase [Lautropia sp.]